ncbi:MAG: hypothetical protein AAFY16_13360 [Cyanobacteria bacterium J06642_3]
MSKNSLGSGLSEPMMIADSYAKMGDYSSAIAAVKLIPKDIYQAQTLKAIALKHARSPQEIDQATWQVLNSLI